MTSRLVLHTGVGSIEIDIDDSAAPLTARFVRQLVEAGHFNGSAFYRSTTLGVDGRQPLIQGGPLAPLFTGSAAPIPRIDLLDTVESTSRTGLTHRRGTVSLARDLNTTGHVLPELFICLDDYPELDQGGRSKPDEQGFPTFGVVTTGLDVVGAIARRDVGGTSPIELLAGEILTEPVLIINATFVASTPVITDPPDEPHPSSPTHPTSPQPAPPHPADPEPKTKSEMTDQNPAATGSTRTITASPVTATATIGEPTTERRV